MIWRALALYKLRLKKIVCVEESCRNLPKREILIISKLQNYVIEFTLIIIQKSSNKCISDHKSESSLMACTDTFSYENNDLLLFVTF